MLMFGLLLAGCSNKKELSLTTFDGKIMGTTYSVKVPKEISTKRKQTLSQEILNFLNGLNSALSTYESDSELSKLNKYQGEWFTLTPLTFEVIRYAQEVAEQTKGAYDVTSGPLVNLWGFGPDGKKKVPSKGAIWRKRQIVGYKNLELNNETKQVKKYYPKMYIDLSSIAKGYAVDKLSDFLSKKGLSHHLVEIGGELKARGKKGDKNWTVGIEKPAPNQKAIQKAIPLDSQMAIATSGNYRNFFESNGKKYSHTIDPRKGKPVQHKLLSVSVIAETAMKSDAWATALMVLGPEEGFLKAQELGLNAYFIFESENGVQTKSTGKFSELIK